MAEDPPDLSAPSTAFNELNVICFGRVAPLLVYSLGKGFPKGSLPLCHYSRREISHSALRSSSEQELTHQRCCHVFSKDVQHQLLMMNLP